MSDDTALDTARQSAAAMQERDACTRALGIEVEIPAPGSAVARMRVRDDMLNGFGVCHGGMVFALADTAFAFACNACNDETLSVSANIEWLAAVRGDDRLTATAARDEHRGRHGFYTVRVHNQDDALVAIFRGHAVSQGRPVIRAGESDTR